MLGINSRWAGDGRTGKLGRASNSMGHATQLQEMANKINIKS